MKRLSDFRTGADDEGDEVEDVDEDGEDDDGAGIDWPLTKSNDVDGESWKKNVEVSVY